MISVIFNFVLYSAYHTYLGTGDGVNERFYSGDLAASDKIALIYVEGTISPPFTGHIMKAIEQARTDDHVKGVVLVVDSPGGLVADSHEIYHELRKLSSGAPQADLCLDAAARRFGRLLRVDGCGPRRTAFCRTDHVVWIHRSDHSALRHLGLADKLGVKEDSPKTGVFKDTLSIFRPVSAAEKELWKPILDDSLDRFVKVIADSRKMLTVKEIRELATGQIFTSNQAKEKKLIDKIGYLDDAIEALKTKLQLTHVRVVKYESSQNLLETLLSSRMSVSNNSRNSAPCWKARFPGHITSSRRPLVSGRQRARDRAKRERAAGGELRWQGEEALHGDPFEVIEHAVDAECDPIGVLSFARLLQFGGDLGQFGKPVTPRRAFELVRPAAEFVERTGSMQFEHGLLLFGNRVGKGAQQLREVFIIGERGVDGRRSRIELRWDHHRSEKRDALERILFSS